MCGVVALLRLGERPLPPVSTIHAMAAAIAHRGPDARGVYADDDVQLAAVRLAVVDPQGGTQPAFGCSRDVVCVYNGEIYNHRDLHRDLSDRGHALVDGCDTSLLPHLYEEQGDALVERLRGMFALALWDAPKRRLLLARDRLGIKPLFYALTPHFLVVASEAKAIFASALLPAVIDKDSLDDLFSLGYPCPPRTMFEGVFELRPGHTLVAHARRRPEPPRRWWRAPLPPRGEHRAGSMSSVAAELRELLQEAVGLHLQADVPVAVSLSGGLDSSLIAALAKHSSGTAPTTFSITFDDPAFDESTPARLVSRHLGGPAHEVHAGADAAALLPAMVRALELPLLMPGAIGGLLLSARERAAGVRVMLTGDGADEILGGYDVFRAARARTLLARPGFRRLRPLLFALASRHQPCGMAAHLEKNARAADDIARSFGGVYPPWFEQWSLLDIERSALLGLDARRVRPTAEAPAGFGALVRDDIKSLDPFDAAVALELETRLPSWILPISDRSSMAHGIEARVPLLDDRVVAFALQVSPQMKMRGLREKAVLRAAGQGLLPKTILRRRKQPFMMPISPWFFGEQRPAFVDDALSPRSLQDTGLFAPEVVLRLRASLDAPAPADLQRLRLELVLMLVLQTQLLAQQFSSPPGQAPAPGSGPSVS